MSKIGTDYKGKVNKLLDGKEDYVIIRIGEETGQVMVFGIDNNNIISKKSVGAQKKVLQPLKSGEMGMKGNIEFIDAAFWYKGSPICVVHGNRRY